MVKSFAIAYKKCNTTMLSFSTNLLLHWLLLALIAFPLTGAAAISTFAGLRTLSSVYTIAAGCDEEEEGGSHRRGTGVDRDAFAPQSPSEVRSCALSFTTSGSC